MAVDRFEHVPSGDPPDVDGLRYCLVCDEAWPCGPRQRRDAHDAAHLHDGDEGPAYSDPSWGGLDDRA